MTPEQFFTRADGGYRFARWARPIVPIVFGVDDATLAVVKGAIEAVVALAGHTMAETDPEQGANLFMFFFRDWDEVLICPDLLRVHHYLEGGLTHTTNRNAATLAQVWNIVSRAIVYYSLKPTSLKLGFRLAKQLSLLPLRLALVVWRKCTQSTSKV